MEGNWPTHVEIPITLPSHAWDIMKQAQQQVSTLCHTDVTWQPLDSLHISLSQTLPIRYPLHHPLQHALVHIMHDLMECSHVWTHWTMYVNDEKTRSFLSLTIDEEYTCETYYQIMDAIHRVNTVFTKFGLQTYYEVAIHDWSCMEAHVMYPLSCSCHGFMTCTPKYHTTHDTLHAMV